MANGVSLGPISGAKANKLYYSFTVPAGAAQASFAITGSSGDCDIYVRYGAVPTESTWDYRPYTGSSNETVTVNAPRAGTWYVMLRGYTAYSGVYLKALQNTIDGTVASAPTFTPAAGTFSGQVSVRLASSTPNAVIRFTLNGATPTASSEVYIAPILVTATTEIKAVAFATGYTASPVAAGTFTIRDTIQMLVNNTPVANLSGALGSTTNFKFAVPAGAVSVTFSIWGNSGDSDLYVKYGQPATTSVWDQRPYLSSSNETVTISPAQAGDYFLMVHGYTAYSGLTIKATYSGTAAVGKPDIVVWGPAINPYITTETFASNACEIEEGTITAGTKKLLRFTTQTRNIGTADLVLGNPATSPLFQWGGCHGHYHFQSFAQYRLLDATGSLVGTGKKVGFCLMDITRIDTSVNPSPRYTCSNQGIQAGWADVYSSNLSGQWIDITGLPAGQYILEITMDPLNIIDELD
ncbi:MAG: lysyl oxidase family protein [Burkholderiales bacterium]